MARPPAPLQQLDYETYFSLIQADSTIILKHHGLTIYISSEDKFYYWDDRKWQLIDTSTGGGGGEDLAATLVIGNSTGPTDIIFANETADTLAYFDSLQTLKSAAIGSGLSLIGGLLSASTPSLSGTAPINYLAGVISITQSGVATDGYLSSIDWNIFNNKQTALGFTPEDVTNKATSFAVLNSTLYPTTQAVATYVTSFGYGTGTVTSVTGTTNRITSSGGTTPAIDISASYVGQTSITTLGTITTGVWNGIAITDTYISSAATWNAKQDALSGTGLVYSTAGVISYDINTYATRSVTSIATATTTIIPLSVNNINYSITALASALTIQTSGVGGDFDKIVIRIKDNGTARALTFDPTYFEAKGQALPTTTVLGKVITIGFIFDSVTGKFGCVSVAQEI